MKGCQDLLECIPGRSHVPGLGATPKSLSDTRSVRLRSRSGGKMSKAEELSCKSTSLCPLTCQTSITLTNHSRGLKSIIHRIRPNIRTTHMITADLSRPGLLLKLCCGIWHLHVRRRSFSALSRGGSSVHWTTCAGPSDSPPGAFPEPLLLCVRQHRPAERGHQGLLSPSEG